MELEEQLHQANKIESISILTGGVAHDFNNILGIIFGNTELALEDVPKWSPAYSNLEEIKKATLPMPWNKLAETLPSLWKMSLWTITRPKPIQKKDRGDS